MVYPTPEDILNLWHDNTWKGSFTGIRTFQTLLKTDKNIDISEAKLYNILKQDSLYLKHLKPQRKLKRRSYNLNYYGELVQADLAYMFNTNGYQYFLVVIDCFSLKVFCEPLKTKTSDEVLKAFLKTLKKFKFKQINKIEVDQGQEFSKVKQYCEKNHIIFKLKFGSNKASFAEWIISILKRRLYKILRDKLSHNWISVLQIVSEQFNDTPQKKIGFLKPKDINSIFDSVLVSESKLENNVKVENYTPYKVQNENQTQYESQKQKLQENSYVYLDFKQSFFGKSFDIQVLL